MPLFFVKVRQIRYSRLLLSQSPRNALKHFEMSVPRHIRFAKLRKKYIEQPHLTNEYVIWLLKIGVYIENIVEKKKNCSLGAVFPLFHRILSPRLFEIRQVEIPRVDCMFKPTHDNSRRVHRHSCSDTCMSVVRRQQYKNLHFYNQDYKLLSKKHSRLYVSLF